MTLEEVLEAEHNGWLVEGDLGVCKIRSHKREGSDRNFVFYIQRQTLGVPCDEISVDLQTVMAMRRVRDD